MDDSFIDGSPESLADEIDLAAGETEDLEGLDGLEEDEADEFGRVFRRLRRKLAPLAPLLRRLAPVAARAVMGGAAPGMASLLREEEDEEDEDGLFEDGLLGEDGLFGLGEEEEEDFEDEDLEDELDPEAEELAELLATAAGFAESEEEAAGLIGGVTIQILGPAPVRIRRMTPMVVRRAVKLTKLLRRSPRTRPLVPVVAAVTRATKKSLARRAAQGRPVTKSTVARTMAKATARTLRSPQRVAKVLARNVVKRRRLDQKAIKRAERPRRKTRKSLRPS
ncbi:hypothetical protein SH611_11705 [Geminicoccaceae bacterium 1502E]|nr:hypothetical protein [Geminicoccaceae bacterium 1502E]